MDQQSPAQSLKPLVKRGTGKFVRLRSLKCYPEILTRVREGVPLAEVVRFIQQDRQEYTDVTPGSLTTLLTDFRNSLPLAQRAEGHLPEAVSRAMRKVEAGLDEMAELEKLYKMQMDRINIDLASEKKIGKLFATTVKEIQTAAELLVKHAGLKMDLGLTERHIGTLDLDTTVQDVSQKYGPAVAKVLADPEARKRVTTLAMKLLAAAGKEEPIIIDSEAVEVLPAETGK
jgi:hypothetical protein